MKSGIRDLIVTLSSRVGAMLIAFVMQSVLAWGLGPEGRGEYAVCLIFSTLSASCFSFGIDWASSYFIASKKKPFNQVVTTSIGFVFVIPFIMWPTLNLIIKLPLTFFLQASEDAFVLSIIWAISTVGFLVSTSILRGVKAFLLLAFLSLAKLSWALLVTAFLMFSLKLEVLAPILGDLTGNFFAFCTMVILIRFKWNWRIEIPGRNVLKSIFSYALRMVGGTIGMAVNLRIGTVLISFFVSKEKIGYFALAMAILTQLGTLADALNNIMLPRVAGSNDGRKLLVATTARWLSTLVFCAGLLIIALSKWIIPLFFSEQFLPSIVIICILFPGMWARSICKVLFSYFNGQNLPQVVSINTGVNITLSTFFMLVCLPYWGIMGAAFANTVANLISTVFLVTIFFKYSNIDNKNILFTDFDDIRTMLGRIRIHKTEKMV